MTSRTSGECAGVTEIAATLPCERLNAVMPVAAPTRVEAGAAIADLAGDLPEPRRRGGGRAAGASCPQNLSSSRV